MLFEAVERRDWTATVFLLINCHVDPNKGQLGPDRMTRTPLHRALEMESHLMCSNLLNSGADPSVLCEYPHPLYDRIMGSISTLHTFSLMGTLDEDLLDRLLAMGGKKVVSAQLTFGNREDEPESSSSKEDGDAHLNGATCLHLLTIKRRSRPEVTASCAKQLLEAGTEIDARNAAGQTALHLASHFARFSLARVLLSFGADPTLTDDQGRSPADMSLDGVIEGINDEEQKTFLEECKTSAGNLNRAHARSSDKHQGDKMQRQIRRRRYGSVEKNAQSTPSKPIPSDSASSESPPSNLLPNKFIPSTMWSGILLLSIVLAICLVMWRMG